VRAPQAALPRAPAPARRAIRALFGNPLRTLLALVGGVLWWWAALRHGLHGLRGGAAGRWEGALLAGWSLGLVPVHAVAARHRAAGAAGSARLPGTGGTGGTGAQPPMPAVPPVLPELPPMPGPSLESEEGTGPR
jgi:hypothetical protein